MFVQGIDISVYVSGGSRTLPLDLLDFPDRVTYRRRAVVYCSVEAYHLACLRT